MDNEYHDEINNGSSGNCDGENQYQNKRELNTNQESNENHESNVNQSQGAYQSPDADSYRSVSQNPNVNSYQSSSTPNVNSYQSGSNPNINSYQSSSQNMNSYQGSQFNQDGIYRYGKYYPGNNNDAGYQYDNTPGRIYPTPELKTKKAKKTRKAKTPGKHRFAGAAKLTAAAIIFGLISGGVFQGYNYFTQPKSEVSSDNNNNMVTIPEVDSDTASVDNNTVVPASSTTDGIVTDVSGVVDEVMPSIVAINSSGTMTGSDFFGREVSQPFEGSGSGIIIGQNTSQILIVTNNHVIQDAQSVEIIFDDKTKAKATVKGADSNADLAVLSVSMKDISEDTLSKIKVATLGSSDDVKAGEMAIAIGNALGYGQSVTVGYISAVDREVDIDNNKMTLLQTDAAINPGNSGGALLNARGEVIGINSVKYADTDVEGMGYAIPISTAIPMINELMNRETVAKADQGYLGLYVDSAQNVTEAYAQRFNMPVGVYVNEVAKDSPAEKAGLKQGMIITKINDTQIKTIDDLVSTLSYHKAGETITITAGVFGNGEYTDQTLTVTLGDK